MSNYNTMTAAEIAGALKFAAILCDEEKLFPGLSGLLLRAADIASAVSQEKAKLVLLAANNQGKKIQAIKAAREYLKLGLKDAKEAVEAGDVTIFEGAEVDVLRVLKDFRNVWGNEIQVEVQR